MSKVICIGLEKVYFLTEDCHQLITDISFEDLTEVIYTLDRPNLIVLNYKNGEPIIFDIIQSKKFIKKLSSYYMIYNMEKYCKIKEIKITKKKSEDIKYLENKDETLKTITETYDKVFKRCPKGYVVSEYKDYK